MSPEPLTDTERQQLAELQARASVAQGPDPVTEPEKPAPPAGVQTGSLSEQAGGSPAPATPPAPPPDPDSEEGRKDARLAELRDAKFYCPACGLVSAYPRECSGPPVAGHSPVEMVPTAEVTSGDPSEHTPAPATE